MPLARYPLAVAVLAVCTGLSVEARSQDSVTRARPVPTEPEYGLIGILPEGGDPTAPDRPGEIGVSFESDSLGLAEPGDLYAPEPLSFAPGGLQLSATPHGSDAPAMGYVHWITRVRDRQALARWVAFPRRIAAIALQLARRW